MRQKTVTKAVSLAKMGLRFSSKMQIQASMNCTVWIGVESIRGHRCLNPPDPWMRHKHLDYLAPKGNIIPNIKTLLLLWSYILTAWSCIIGYLDHIKWASPLSLLPWNFPSSILQTLKHIKTQFLLVIPHPYAFKVSISSFS